LGDLETTTTNPQYLDKERVFLEANDIQQYVYSAIVFVGLSQTIEHCNNEGIALTTESAGAASSTFRPYHHDFRSSHHLN
jgi:hypothetical protein